MLMSKFGFEPTKVRDDGAQVMATKSTEKNVVKAGTVKRSIKRSAASLPPKKRRCAKYITTGAKRQKDACNQTGQHTDFVAITTTRSLEPIIQRDASPHTLVLGTHPSLLSLASSSQQMSARAVRIRGGRGPQNYGHPNNAFWFIAGSALNFRRDRTPYRRQTELFAAAGYALWDVIRECKRKGSLDQNIASETVVTNDIPGLLQSCPTLHRLVIAQTAAGWFRRRCCFASWLHTGRIPDKHLRHVTWDFVVVKNRPTFDLTQRVLGHFKAVRVTSTTDAVSERSTRRIELVVVPSTSPANARTRNAHKEQMWHRGCYRLDRVPKSYTCCVCGAAGAHWSVDCTAKPGGYLEWRKQRQRIPANKDPDLEGTRWYV